MDQYGPTVVIWHLGILTTFSIYLSAISIFQALQAVFTSSHSFASYCSVLTHYYAQPKIMSAAWVQANGFYIKFEAIHRIAKQHNFAFDRRFNVIAHNYFDDFLVRMGKLDMRSESRIQDDRLLVISNITPVVGSLRIAKVELDDKALRDKEWLVDVGVDPDELEWGAMLDMRKGLLGNAELLTPRRRLAHKWSGRGSS